MKPTKLLTTGTLIASALCVFPTLAGANPFEGYDEFRLVSDIPGLAAHTDPDLVNPWGIAASATSPYWISDNGTGLATLYNGLGQKRSLVVTIPGPGGATGTPTGAVFNSASTKFNGDRFIFDTEDGLIAGWRGHSERPQRLSWTTVAHARFTKDSRSPTLAPTAIYTRRISAAV